MPNPTPHNFLGLLPEQLIRSVRNRRCVVFAGAGLSAQAVSARGDRLPTWEPLLVEMIDWCIGRGVPLRATRDEFREVLEKKRLTMVAEELHAALGSRLNICIADILTSKNVKPGDAHRLLFDTPWAAALTSNYDTLIEGSYAHQNGGLLPRVFAPGDVGGALDCLRRGEFFVLKVHGDVNISKSIVLGTRDYSRVLYAEPAYRSFLETIFAAYTVLFLGFGGNDPDLDGVVERLSAIYEWSLGHHYLLVAEDTYSAFERRRLVEDKKLECISYPRDDTHSQLTEFLKALAWRSNSDVAEIDVFPGQPGGPPRVFISAAPEQWASVAAAAHEAGLRVWEVPSELHAGAPITDLIAKAIDECDGVILAVSADATESRIAMAELDRALGAEKPIYPILFPGANVETLLQSGLFWHVVPERSLSASEHLRLVERLRAWRERLVLRP